jgi:hypothetical protein
VTFAGGAGSKRSNPTLEAVVGGSETGGLTTSLYAKFCNPSENCPWDLVVLKDAVPLDAAHITSKPQTEAKLEVSAERRSSTSWDDGGNSRLQAERVAVPKASRKMARVPRETAAITREPTLGGERQ